MYLSLVVSSCIACKFQHFSTQILQNRTQIDRGAYGYTTLQDGLFHVAIHSGREGRGQQGGEWERRGGEGGREKGKEEGKEGKEEGKEGERRERE